MLHFFHCYSCSPDYSFSSVLGSELHALFIRKVAMKKRDTEISLYHQWHRALQPSPTGWVLTRDVKQGCEFSVSLLISAPSSDSSPQSPVLPALSFNHRNYQHCPSSSTGTGVLASGASVFPSCLTCSLQTVLLCVKGFHTWASDTSWLVLNGVPSGTRWLWCKKLLFTWHMEFMATCPSFSLSSKPAGTHFKTCGACSGINTNIPEHLLPWVEHSKLLLSLDVF